MFHSMLHRRPTATGIIALVALVLAMGGTATAAKLISGKQIQNNSVTGQDIKNGSLAAGDLSSKARAALKGNAGAAGAVGAPGAKGDKGDKGDRGPSNAYGAHVDATHAISDDAATHEILGGTLPDGSYVIQAKFQIENDTNATQTPDCAIVVKRGELEETVDQIDRVVLDAAGTIGEDDSYSLLAVAQVDAGTNPYFVRCRPDIGKELIVRDRTLVATQVGALGS